MQGQEEERAQGVHQHHQMGLGKNAVLHVGGEETGVHESADDLEE